MGEYQCLFFFLGEIQRTVLKHLIGSLLEQVPTMIPLLSHEGMRKEELEISVVSEVKEEVHKRTEVDYFPLTIFSCRLIDSWWIALKIFITNSSLRPYCSPSRIILPRISCQRVFCRIATLLAFLR